jgi:CRISPR-associated protein Cas6/Cse3/CasE subtype I-E
MLWHSVCFEGVLQVQDARAMRIAVESGIGTSKGMGFGLLSLMPSR